MMEDDKKKKRNKKKKNKQNNKVAEDTAVASNGEGGAASVDPQNHLDNGQNHHRRAIGAATNNDEVKVNTQQSNGAEPLNVSFCAFCYVCISNSCAYTAYVLMYFLCSPILLKWRSRRGCRSRLIDP